MGCSSDLLAPRPTHTLERCMIDGKLGSMGEPSVIVLAGRLVWFCCPICEPKVFADPGKYLSNSTSHGRSRTHKRKP